LSLFPHPECTSNLEEQPSEAAFFLETLQPRSRRAIKFLEERISATAHCDYTSDCFNYTSDCFDYTSGCFDYIFDYFDYISNYYDYFLVAGATALRSPARHQLLIGYIKQT
jgi:hypothetical protein